MPKPALSLNPIIAEYPQDTLHRAACLAAFIARFHSDRSSWQYLSDFNAVAGPEALNREESRGLALVCETLVAALRYECEGREGGGA